MFNLDGSHELWTAGGAIWCNKCGCVATRDRKSYLHLGCGSNFKPDSRGQEVKMPPGSHYRLQCLMKGSTAGTKWDSWPDGTPKETVLEGPRAPLKVKIPAQFRQARLDAQHLGEPEVPSATYFRNPPEPAECLVDFSTRPWTQGLAAILGSLNPTVSPEESREAYREFESLDLN